jgi:hypothetical protein
LPLINSPFNELIVNENDNAQQNRIILSNFNTPQKKLFKLKRKKSKKRREYSSYKNGRILRLEELEAIKL